MLKLLYANTVVFFIEVDMGGKDVNYQVVYRDEVLENYRPGGWVFFQRPKECGGGYWLGRTYDDVYMMDFWRPVSLSEGLAYLMTVTHVEAKSDEFDVNFPLF